MESFFVPTESDFRRWIKEALDEYFGEMKAKITQPNQNDEPLLSREAIAKKLDDISLVTLNSWVKAGLPCHKQKGRIYFLYSEVLEYIKKNRPQKLMELL